MTTATVPVTNPAPTITRKEAKAAGLKVHAWGACCSRCHTQHKFVKTGRCATCHARNVEVQKVRDQRLTERVRAEVLKGARATVLRELQAEEKQRTKEADKVRRADERAQAKADREAAKLAAQKTAIADKAKATKKANEEAAEARRRAQQELQPLVEVALLVPPWD